MGIHWFPLILVGLHGGQEPESLAAYENPRQPTAPESCPYRRKRFQDPRLSDFHWFSLILVGFQGVRSQKVWQPTATHGNLRRPSRAPIEEKDCRIRSYPRLFRGYPRLRRPRLQDPSLSEATAPEIAGLRRLLRPRLQDWELISHTLDARRGRRIICN